MRIYPPEDTEGLPLSGREVHLEMVIDSAGKVRSIKPTGDTKQLEGWINISATHWKFVPALNNRQAVASRMGTSIFPLR